MTYFVTNVNVVTISELCCFQLMYFILKLMILSTDLLNVLSHL